MRCTCSERQLYQVGCDCGHRGGDVIERERDDTTIDDDMFDGDDDPNEGCSNKGGHEFVCSGVAYGGDDERYHGEGVSRCQWCGADGDA